MDIVTVRIGLVDVNLLILKYSTINIHLADKVYRSDLCLVHNQILVLKVGSYT